MDLYDTFVVVVPFRHGNRQPLIDLLKAHQQQQKAPSPDIFEFLIEMAETARLPPRKRGGRTKPQRQGEIKMAVYLAEADAIVLAKAHAEQHPPYRPPSTRRIIKEAARMLRCSVSTVEAVVYSPNRRRRSS